MSSRALKSAARGRYSHRTSALFIIVMLWAGLSWASVRVGQSLDATLAVTRNALLPAPAYAGDEVQQQQAERQREAQQQQAERQREAQQQQAERQREAQQQQAERQSENHANEIEAGRTENNAGSQSDDSGNSRERYRESDQNRSGHSNEDGLPKTLAEAWQRLTQGNSGKAGTHAPTNPLATGEHSFAHDEIVATNLGRISHDRVKALGFKIISSADLSNFGMRIERLLVPKGMDVATASRLLETEIPAGAFSPNHIYRIYHSADGDKLAPRRDSDVRVGSTQVPGCDRDRCFGPSLIRWNGNVGTCARRVRVGIIDTSFDLTHPALVGHRFNSGIFLAEGTARGHDWHGTAVLSILAGDPRSSTPGLIPDAEFFLASAFGADEKGDAETSTVNLLKALAWLDAFDVRVVNLSFSGPPDELLEAALARMHTKGVVFVAAAGNEGPAAPPGYPAAYPSVIAVTAVSRSLQSYRYANRGTYVDLAAPGVDIWTALPDRKQGYRSGTSFAAPFVTSIIATMLRADALPNDKADLLKRLVFKDLGEPGRDAVFGEGLPLSPSKCGAAPSAAMRAPHPALSPQTSASWEPMVTAD